MTEISLADVYGAGGIGFDEEGPREGLTIEMPPLFWVKVIEGDVLRRGAMNWWRSFDKICMNPFSNDFYEVCGRRIIKNLRVNGYNIIFATCISHIYHTLLICIVLYETLFVIVQFLLV